MQTYQNLYLTHRFQPPLLAFGSFVTALFLVSIYFSTSLAIIFSAVLGLTWLLSCQFMVLPNTLKKYPVAAWSLLIFLCFVVGLSYGNASQSDAWVMLSKYREFALIPILIVFLRSQQNRNWTWNAFIAASILTLLLSILMHFGILDTPEQGPSWKSRITHSLFMAFFAFYCIHNAYDGKRFSLTYWVLFLSALFNIFFIVEGRTGQLIVMALIALFAFQRTKMKGRVLTSLILIVFIGLFIGYSDKANRINEGFANTKAYLQEHPEQTDSSMGLRYTFWKYSLKLIEEKPLIGHGTGSFSQEYQRIAKNEGLTAKHPHNESLLITVQLGLLGLIPYLGFMISQYECAQKLSTPDKWLAQGLLVSLLVISCFNSPFYDHTEGHWFACMIALCFAGLRTDNEAQTEHSRS